MSDPVLWHLKVSPYNEKARWALDYKGVPHVRKGVTPIRHDVLSRRLGGRGTMPVLAIDGRAIGDSSEIIEELERRWPEPALYPADPDERARALELEDLVDEQLGPRMRRLVLHHALRDPELLLGAFTPDLPPLRRRIAKLTFPLVRRRTLRDFGIDERTVAEAFETIAELGERLRADRGADGYLVGDSFSVADLTLASICAPAVAPVEFQYPQPQRDHPLFAPLREALACADLLDWTRRVYRRHRGRSAEIAPS
jgi:glutathione S-transferase